MKKLCIAASICFVLLSTAAFAANSPNGTIVRFSDPHGTSLTDSYGVWTFGTGPDSNGNYQVLLNGALAADAMAVLMEMDSGHVKVQSSNLVWWAYVVGWQSATAPIIAPPPPPPPGANTWIADNFAQYPVHTTCPVQQAFGYPSLVKGVTCQGGYQIARVAECDNPDDVPYCPNAKYTDERIAIVNTTLKNGNPDGPYASGLITLGDNNGWNNNLDTFLLNVTVSPYWPAFVDYATTNFDGITFDAGCASFCANNPVPGTGGHVYAKGVTISCPVAAGAPKAPCWADAAFDVKPLTFMCVNCHTEGSGLNTLKLWMPGPDSTKGWTGHYIVNSTINNARYVNNPPVGNDGGLVYSWDCSKLVLNIYNSTFNGSPTLPRNMITCELPGTPTIHYLTRDPTQTGEMHPMFR